MVGNFLNRDIPALGWADRWIENHDAADRLVLALCAVGLIVAGVFA
jgi:hypothetical protein